MSEYVGRVWWKGVIGFSELGAASNWIGLLCKYTQVTIFISED